MLGGCSRLKPIFFSLLERSHYEDDECKDTKHDDQLVDANRGGLVQFFLLLPLLLCAGLQRAVMVIATFFIVIVWCVRLPAFAIRNCLGHRLSLFSIHFWLIFGRGAPGCLTFVHISAHVFLQIRHDSVVTACRVIVF